jgi:hypothetical protein
MDTMNKQIKKVIKLHMDSVHYYRTCAEITTEDDLIELFDSLSERRKKMTDVLVAIYPINSDKDLWLLRDVFSCLQHAWYHMKLALIINNRSQILQYSFENEHDMLQEYEQMAHDKSLPEVLLQHGTHHQQLLKENLRLISKTPIEKFSRQKSQQLALQKSA